MTAPLLRIENVYKAYGHNLVLRNIDLDVNEHEVICLIGASGCGKSTLLRCINLLETINSGRILLNGEDITAEGVNTNLIRRRIGIVFQSFNLFPHMSVLRNITLAPRKVLKLGKRQADRRLTDEPLQQADRIRPAANTGEDEVR